jgi:hypothetical protein
MPMKAVIAIVVVFVLGGCSFVGVKGPGALPDPAPPADEIHCTTSDALPTIDALGGIAALAASGGGIIAEETGNHGVFEHWEAYYALPLLAVSIVYFVASGHGTHAVEQCAVAKDPTLPPVQ